MEATVDLALQEFRSSLVTKLQAVLEAELAARTASLEERERKLEARSTALIEKVLPLEQPPGAGLGIFVPRISIASLNNPPLQVSETQVGLATRASGYKLGQALEHRNKTDAAIKAVTGLTPQVMPTYKLPVQSDTGQSFCLPPGGGGSSSVVSSLAVSSSTSLVNSARRELSPTLSGSHLRVPSPVATPTHRAERMFSAPDRFSPSPMATPTQGVERRHSAPHQLPPSLPAPLTCQQRVSYQKAPTSARSPFSTPGQMPRLSSRSPSLCQTPFSASRNMVLNPANRRTASAPACVMQFLVPRGSVGPSRAEFDGGRMFRALDSSRESSISPEEDAKYAAGQRHNSTAQVVKPPIQSPRQPASSRASLSCAGSPALAQSTSVTNLSGATPVNDFRQRQPASSRASLSCAGSPALTQSTSVTNLPASSWASLSCAGSPALAQSTSVMNLRGATPVNDFRQSQTNQSNTPSPVPSKVGRRSTIGGLAFLRGAVSGQGGIQSRDNDKHGC